MPTNPNAGESNSDNCRGNPQSITKSPFTSSSGSPQPQIPASIFAGSFGHSSATSGIPSPSLSTSRSPTDDELAEESDEELDETELLDDDTLLEELDDEVELVLELELLDELDTEDELLELEDELALELEPPPWAPYSKAPMSQLELAGRNRLSKS